jgi:hypothetical protein
MSSGKLKKVENSDFVKRFVEVCGSSQPVEVARLLNVSYQAAKNYLNGRMPDSNVLVIISERTPYSIHWLLTGQGRKFVESSQTEDTLRPSDQLRKFVRRECLELIEEVLSRQSAAAQSKVVVLTSNDIKEEKVMDENAAFSGKHQ